MRRLPFTAWSLITSGVLLVGVLFWLLFADQLFPTISDDFTYRANILSYDNFFDEHKNDFSGDILSKTKYSYQVEKKENNVLTIHNVFEVRKPSGDTIFAVDRFYGIDKFTGKHVPGYGDKNREGYLFAPKNTGDEFTYWHVNYDAPARMKFQGKEIIEGLDVNRYECDYTADQSPNLEFLPGVPDVLGVQLAIHLALWIEPVTGYLIKYEDHTTAWYYDVKTKKRTHPWNRFHNQFEETSISNQVQIAQLAKDFKLWQYRYFPVSILFLIVIVLSVGFRSDRKRVWRLYFATGLILVTGFSYSFFLYTFLKKNDIIRLETLFNRDCESIRISVQRELERSVDVLNSIKANYLSRNDISREQFRIAVTQTIKNSDNIQAVAWIPYVSGEDRNAAETSAREEGYTDFKFTELKNKKLVTAGKRDSYYPIYYIAPYESNVQALGYDFASSPERKEALDKAASTGEIMVTESIIMVQQLRKKHNKSFLVMMPLFENEVGISNTHRIHSYISAGINIYDLMQEAVSRVSISNNVAVTVTDLVAKEPEILYTNAQKDNTYQFEKTSTLQVANGLWKLQFKSTPTLSRLESSWFTIALPIVVALMSFILSIFVFTMLTDESKKLRNINFILTKEVSERKKAEKNLNQHLHVLESQNIQLSDFCYIISHNLRGPLVNISMLIDYIENSEDEADKEEMFSKIRPVVNTINETFNELVESLQVKFDLDIQSEKINVKENIDKMLISLLEFEITSTDATFDIDISEAPIIHFPEKYFDSILFNLISNSLKYKSPDRKPFIKIKTEKIKHSIVLSVTDNGLGIDLKLHRNNLFKIRKVFHKHPDARGFGLFMTKTQIEAMGGKIWAESIPNVGSTFFVEFTNQEI